MEARDQDLASAKLLNVLRRSNRISGDVPAIFPAPEAPTKKRKIKEQEKLDDGKKADSWTPEMSAFEEAKVATGDQAVE